MDKMREEFEAWKKSVEPSANLSKAEGIYISNDTFFDWQAWQASRKALVVELPNAWEDGCELVMNAHRVRMELERAGVSYE